DWAIVPERDDPCRTVYGANAGAAFPVILVSRRGDPRAPSHWHLVRGPRRPGPRLWPGGGGAWPRYSARSAATSPSRTGPAPGAPGQGTGGGRAPIGPDRWRGCAGRRVPALACRRVPAGRAVPGAGRARGSRPPSRRRAWPQDGEESLT